MNDYYYKQLMEDSPIGYAYHKIISDKEGIPYGYELIEGNVAFEKLTGPGIFLGIRGSEFNWMELYRDLKINEDKKEFEMYNRSRQRKYKSCIRFFIDPSA